MNITMSVATKTIVKPPSMAAINGCVISLPSKHSSPPSHISILSRLPVKLNLSFSYCSSSSAPPLYLLKKKGSRFQSAVSVLAAQHEEENSTTIVFEEESDESFKWGNQEQYSFDQDAKVFVGNLPYDVDDEKLSHLFEQAGVVQIAEVIYNRGTDQSRGFGFVTMGSVEDAEKAVDMLNRYDLNGRLLIVDRAGERGSRPERLPRMFEPSYKIYVGNLPWDVDDARLEEVFLKHGKVICAKVVCDRETGRSRGFGFVTMSSESELNDAIENLDGQDLGGRTIKVSFAQERPSPVPVADI